MKTKTKLLTSAALLTGVGAVITKKYFNNKEDIKESVKITNQQVYLIGGGLASMAAAAYLIQDGHMDGKNIHIFEGMKILGGSNDGTGSIENGFICRGGRMLNEETYENFWELFDRIPSIDHPGQSVTKEILDFDHLHPTEARARLIDCHGKILDVKSMGFDNNDRLTLGKLMITPESKLDDISIEQWFKDTPHFFTTNFWYMWQTTFAFQKWSSVFELKRYMNRMIFEFPRIETLAGVTRTPYNQYESVILPIKKYLDSHNVNFITNTTVTDIDFKDDETITAKVIHINKNGKEEKIILNDNDLCIMTNACMTDSATLGDYKTPAPKPVERPISGELWYKVAKKKTNLGNPEPFFNNAKETNWESITVTLRGNKFLKMIEEFTTNIPGSGALMTFKDSSWLMSIVIATQPHFKAQDANTTIFWGYGLYTDRLGDYIKKPMKDCTGEEIFDELLYHLHLIDRKEEIKEDIINVIPCMMPYVDAQFQPRKMSDRPNVVPKGSTNFAMISQFVEIPEDMVFTEEYSVRAARIAVYKLLGINKPICKVTPYNKDPKVLKKALETAYR
ncbi:oleate hydratase [Thomasclavelia cocleata]|uniref:oleate hydratase n=1 Tax=Thomasclavelia cocleata TaxID=69824 RepID=UPI00272A0963|nr:oleate hydratase [Thomasclavelia cocleata]